MLGGIDQQGHRAGGDLGAITAEPARCPGCVLVVLMKSGTTGLWVSRRRSQRPRHFGDRDIPRGYSALAFRSLALLQMERDAPHLLARLGDARSLSSTLWSVLPGSKHLIIVDTSASRSDLVLGRQELHSTLQIPHPYARVVVASRDRRVEALSRVCRDLLAALVRQ